MKQTLKFTLILVALVALATLGSLGCHPKPSLPAGSFRLTVTHVLDDSDAKVMVLHLEAYGDQSYQVWSTNKSGSHLNYSVFDSGSTEGERRQAQVKIYAFQVSPNGDNKSNYVKTSTGGGHTLREVPLGTALDQTFSVTVQDGIYPLNTSLVIGREDGGDINLAVGVQEKLAAMRVPTKISN